MPEYELNQCIKCGTMKHLNTCQRCYEELNSINMQQSMKDKAELTTEIDKLENQMLRKQSRNQFLEDRIDHYKKEIARNTIDLKSWANGDAVKQMQYAYGLYHNESVEIHEKLKKANEAINKRIKGFACDETCANNPKSCANERFCITVLKNIKAEMK